MRRLLTTAKVKTMVGLLTLCALIISVGAAPANAYDYNAEFIQMAGWLTAQQVPSGANLGGIYEGEDYHTAIETDNTSEAIWIWSRYAEITGDYTTYLTNINNAWTYCLAHPSWLEGGSLTNPLPYYSTYNIGWGLLAEMKYRQVYQGHTGYVDHTSYGTSCANALVNYTPSTTATTDVLCTGIASGALYQYGVNVGSATYKSRAVTLGGNVRTWLNGSTSRFASESWAVSGGIAVWGVLNSYYKENSGGDTWATTANTYMPLNASNGSNNSYEYGHDGWYAWGHYAVSEYLGSGSFTKYQNIIDLLLGTDGDNDGGIRQGLGFADNQDYAWPTNIMQHASNFGLVVPPTYYTVSGTVTLGGSGLAGVTMNGLPGNPVTNASGVYSAQVISGWSGTVTPTMTGYTFSPTSRTYSDVTSDQTGEDYTATPDTTPPTPNPMTWATVPTATGPTSITMTATTATDISGVEYYFECTAGGGHNSDWQDSTTYQDTGLSPSTQYTYRVKARDKSTNHNETGWSSAESATTPVQPPMTVYDFSSGAGTKHYAWGTYTDSWTADVENQRRKTPEVGTEVSSVMADAYTRLASSDNSRYTNPDESSGDESTFIAEFNIDENPDDVVQLDVLWEGYGNASHHMELYVWDYVQGNWGNGQGSYGDNNFMDDGSGTSDFVLSGSITQDPSRYIDPATGQITVLVYDDVASEASYHDYISVTVHTQAGPTQHTLTISATAGGTVTQPGIGDFNYPDGTVVDINAVPNTGYHFVSWTGDTGTINNVNSAVTTITMNANYSIQANFAINQYTVTGTAGANGSIDPTSVVVDYNGSQLFTATADTGYEVDKWTVDGNDVQAGGATYTLSNITAGHAAGVTFRILIFAISGYVLELDGNTAVEGVLIQTDDNDVNTVTDANGFYKLWVGYNWSGIVTPQKEGYIFEPNSDTYTNVTQDYGDENYMATLMTFKIAGYVLEQNYVTPISDVNVSAENGGGSWTSKYGGGSWLTDANGYYEVWVDYNWSGNVVPSKYAYAFEPNSRYYEDVNEDYTADQNYIGTLLTYRITGYIKNECNVPIEDVVVSADNGGGQGTTDVNGFYEVWVDYSWSGTVTPSKAHYTFEPNLMSYVDVLADQPDQNYVAHNIYDLDYDCYIGWGDVAVIHDNWLDIGEDIPGDFYKDDANTVNFLDFADFANVWQD